MTLCILLLENNLKARMSIDFTRIGEANDYRYSYPETVAELMIRQDVREVVHDGYCSDPGEDTGEWVYDQVQVLELNNHQYTILQKYIDRDPNLPNENQVKSGPIRLDILQKLFPEKIACGGVYCGYDSDYIMKEGILTYLKDQRQFKEMQLKAYLIAEKDQFKNSQEHYWSMAEEYFRRKDILKAALAEKGLILRSDSKLCEKWMNNELTPTDKYHSIEDVVKCMIECKWCWEYADMRAKMGAYKVLFEANFDPSDKIFSSVKEMILKQKPVPKDLPWPHPIRY